METVTQKFELGFENLGRWIHAHPKRVILVMLLFFASLASNIPSIEVDTSTEAFFSKKTSNKINFIILTLLLCGSIFPADKAIALSGREIMEKVNARDVGDRYTGEREMILIDKKGK